MSKKLRTGIAALAGMLILILDSKTALAGGLAGVQICMMQVIPALLPFFVLSILISAAFTGADIPLLRPIGRLCRMPRGSESLFILGLLGGYPAGAQGVCQGWYTGQLSTDCWAFAVMQGRPSCLVSHRRYSPMPGCPGHCGVSTLAVLYSREFYCQAVQK